METEPSALAAKQQWSGSVHNVCVSALGPLVTPSHASILTVNSTTGSRGVHPVLLAVNSTSSLLLTGSTVAHSVLLAVHDTPSVMAVNGTLSVLLTVHGPPSVQDQQWQ